MPVTTPLLALDHDWHRHRVSARHGRMRPPPLVVAGFDVGWDAEHGRTTRPAAMAVVFGIFPPSLADCIALARQRLHLQPEQARPLAQVLDARLLAVWAWLPTRRQDAYLEFDRATGEVQVWLLDDAGVHAVDAEAPADDLDRAFLDALVLNGHQHWGGEAGLERLEERFGHRPLLVAARVAAALERHPKDPAIALAAARTVWPALRADDEVPWASLHGAVHPWAAAQLGRLALRLGLLRAARVLLGQAEAADAAPIVHFDLGQACEGLGDVDAAARAFARYASGAPTDPDGWRRLLFCRIRLHQTAVADETLARYRACRGEDAALATRLGVLLTRTRPPARERALLAGWCAGRIPEALAGRFPEAGVLDQWGRRRGVAARVALAEALAAAPADPALRLAALLVLPIVAGAAPADRDLSAGEWAAHLLAAVNLVLERRHGAAAHLPAPPDWCFRLGELVAAR
ncbi:MAG: hypothetical protein RLZZ127_1976 [Planctomycetota bacterium]|jgi:hypothetical protein